MAKTAFLGLGVMGFPMAGHLAAKGHTVTVYNRSAAKAATWAQTHGGQTGATPREAAAGAAFVMVGAAPNTGWLDALVTLDAKGFVCTGAEVGGRSTYETSCPGIFAVGDVRAGSVKRVASGVGEGSVVISKVWEHVHAPEV